MKKKSLVIFTLLLFMVTAAPAQRKHQGNAATARAASGKSGYRASLDSVRVKQPSAATTNARSSRNTGAAQNSRTAAKGAGYRPVGDSLRIKTPAMRRQ